MTKRKRSEPRAATTTTCQFGWPPSSSQSWTALFDGLTALRCSELDRSPVLDRQVVSNDSDVLKVCLIARDDRNGCSKCDGGDHDVRHANCSPFPDEIPVDAASKACRIVVERQHLCHVRSGFELLQPILPTDTPQPVYDLSDRNRRSSRSCASRYSLTREATARSFPLMISERISVSSRHLVIRDSAYAQSRGIRTPGRRLRRPSLVRPKTDQPATGGRAQPPQADEECLPRCPE